MLLAEPLQDIECPDSPLGKYTCLLVAQADKRSSTGKTLIIALIPCFEVVETIQKNLAKSYSLDDTNHALAKSSVRNLSPSENKGAQQAPFTSAFFMPAVYGGMYGASKEGWPTFVSSGDNSVYPATLDYHPFVAVFFHYTKDSIMENTHPSCALPVRDALVEQVNKIDEVAYKLSLLLSLADDKEDKEIHLDSDATNGYSFALMSFIEELRKTSHNVSEAASRLGGQP